MKNQHIPQKLILAYSGGLDTSIMIAWLKEHYPNKSIITVTVDVGQSEDLSGIKTKALNSGADKAYLIDAKTEFAEQYVWPLIKSGALYEEQYILGTISRPLIAQKLIEIAKQEKADTIVHGATGKGNDQVRFEYAIKSLAPELQIIAPWRLWDIKSRQDAIAYAKMHNIDIPVTPKSPYSRDQNLWYISHEGGMLEDITQPYPDNLLIMTQQLSKTPDFSETITLGFTQGVPTHLNNIQQDPVNLIITLNKLAGKHGIGVCDIIESRLLGMKTRGVYEGPAAAVIHKAHHILETLCLDKHLLKLKQSLKSEYAHLIYNGQWFTQSKQALDKFFECTQQYMTGEVQLSLFKGTITQSGVFSPNSLYNQSYATFEEDEVYSQQDAQGFINIFSLPSKIFGLVHKGEQHE